MDRLAPNTATLETPSTEGDASGLFRLVCMISPETDNPAPAIRAASTLGNRMFHMILLLEAVLLRASAFMHSSKDMWEDPTRKQINESIKTPRSMQNRMNFFLFMTFSISRSSPLPRVNFSIRFYPP